MDGPDGPRILVVSTDISKLKDQEAILQSVNKNLDDFASMVSHDLQAPLRKIGITKELMELELGDDYPDIIKPYMHDISNGVDGMRDLIRSFLKFMRASPDGIELSPINISDVLTNTLRALNEDIVESEAKIVIPNDDIYVRGEARLLEQVFQNLISNAIKYRSEDTEPRIDISIKAQKQYWSIFVQDNGIGISKRSADQIFDVFGRAKPDVGVEGSGISLALCRRIVTIHGGTIDLVPNIEKGSLFKINLYRAQRPPHV
jgi:signal transduction histidine kinase